MVHLSLRKIMFYNIEPKLREFVKVHQELEGVHLSIG